MMMMSVVCVSYVINKMRFVGKVKGKPKENCRYVVWKFLIQIFDAQMTLNLM